MAGSASGCDASWEIFDAHNQGVFNARGHRFRNHLVRLRQLLDIVDTGEEAIGVGLRGADLEHVQDDLRVLRIVLIPAVVQRLTRPCQRD
jgi:hypothetical protein